MPTKTGAKTGDLEIVEIEHIPDATEATAATEATRSEPEATPAAPAFSWTEEAPAAPAAPKLTLADLRPLTLTELVSLANERRIRNAGTMHRRGLTFEILKAEGSRIPTHGVLTVLPDGFGFLRGPETSYLAGPDDIYVSPSLIRRLDLRTGDTLVGSLRGPRDGERYFALAELESVNHRAPEKVERRSFYKDLTPLHPHERFVLEAPQLRERGPEPEPGELVNMAINAGISTRLLDMLCPLGKGQRALIVSPPRAGKTVLMREIAESIVANHPETILIMLLIDERPEEVTEMIEALEALGGKSEVVSSTFDEPAKRHVQVAEMVTAKALRLAEEGQDVVIMLDSITRLARAYNTVSPSTGRVMSGGIESSALQKPKRFFGAARNLEEGGSLTIIATALIETGSRADEVIFEEFKGTGNAEIVLNRKLADRRVWPAIDINKSGTRKEELLIDRDTLNRVWILRKVLQPLGPEEAIELIIDRVGKTALNRDFLESMSTAE